MPPRDWKIRIRDILDCIDRIDRYTRGYSLEDFRGDDKTIDSVLRNLEIIGEAARFIPTEIQMKYPQVAWREMQAMRNIVIHEYHGVNIEIIWQTVQENLPPLVPALKQILDQEP